VPGAGKVFWLLTLAWFVISIAGVAWAERLDRLVVHSFPAWVALFLTGLGVIMVLVSLAGRKIGGLTAIAVPFLLAALIIGTQPDELRDAYWEFRNAIEDGIEVEPSPSYVPEPVPFSNAAASFSDLYQQITLTGYCTKIGSEQFSMGGSTTQLSYAQIPDDLEIAVDTEYVALAMPQGTNLVVEQSEVYSMTVAWPDRDLVCRSTGVEGFRVDLSNPGGPTLTLTSGAGFPTTIIIEEK